ncbi:thioredoxin reductase [Alphaproteobacteria bacterium]|nr:thioredoxin reductase [Alphaproteobacteria bacterium]
MATHSDIIIIGSGPAGLTAAIYAARAGLDTTVFAGSQPLGQLTTTSHIENYPGFPEKVGGYELMKRIEDQAVGVGAKIVADTVVKVDLSSRPFTLTMDSKDICTAGALVIATGASAKWLGLESEKTYAGAGVSSCATCDGFFFKGRRVAVVGGGNAAVEEALYLAGLASEVFLIHRRDSLRAEKVMQERVLANPKVHVIWDSTITEILGDDKPRRVRAIRIKNLKTEAFVDMDMDGVFVAVGHKPNTELFAGQLDLDAEGYIITKDGRAETSVKGVFAAGDVQDKVFRQAITSAGTGCMAALQAYALLESERK